MSFAELSINPILVRRLEQIGYEEPTPIQAQAIRPIVEGRDVVGLAPTGTGKTAAFAAGVAHQLLGEKPGADARLRALVLCPTRELAQQVGGEIESITRGSALRVACVYGAVGMRPQAEAIARGVDIVVGTPGRMRDLIASEDLTTAHLRHLVIDEADRMLDMGFLPQVDAIAKTLPGARQTLLFSATMPPAVASLAERFMRAPVRIEVGEPTRAAEHVEQHLLPVPDHLKAKLLLRLLEDESRDRVLVFARTRRRVGWIDGALRRNGIESAPIHGDRTQAQRQRALERFRQGRERVIVATDVAARGLHIEGVRTVVNYDLPTQPEEYVHRVGRAEHGAPITRRGGASGEAFTFLSDDELLKWEMIVDATTTVLPEERIEGFDYTEPPRGGKRREAERRGTRKPSKESRDTRRARGTRRGTSKDGHVPPKLKPGQVKRRRDPGRPIPRNEKPGGGVKRPKK